MIINYIVWVVLCFAFGNPLGTWFALIGLLIAMDYEKRLESK